MRGKLPEIDSVTKRIDDLVTGLDIDIRDFYCVTFIGYSRLGYESPDLLKKTLKLKLQQCLQEHPGKQIIVVSGGTEVGIGAVYNLVREDELLRDNVKCIGIVSAESIKSEAYELALSKDKIAIVPALDGSWQTKSPSGYPYILYPAHKYGGEVVALGGGLISYEEANAAKKESKLVYFHSIRIIMNCERGFGRGDILIYAQFYIMNSERKMLYKVGNLERKVMCNFLICI